MSSHRCPHCSGPVDVARTLTHEETWTLMGISKRRFYELKQQGLFKGLASQIPFRFSREKVEAFCANRAVHPLTRRA